MNTDSAPQAQTCDMFAHEWKEVYYGYECIKCGQFVAYGCEPWMPIDDYEVDEYEYTGDIDE